jgi:hypothetical protein
LGTAITGNSTTFGVAGIFADGQFAGIRLADGHRRGRAGDREALIRSACMRRKASAAGGAFLLALAIAAKPALPY